MKFKKVKKNISKKALFDNIQLFTFVIPALTFFVIFFVFPVFNSFYYSLTDWHGLEKNINFIGLKNYFKIFKDEAFLISVKNTFTIVIVVTIVQNFIALALALLLNEGIKSRKILRSVFFLPSILSPLAIGFIWSYIYNPVDGILNIFLNTIGLEVLQNDWLGNIDLAIYSIIFIILWQCSGYSMVIYIAGLDGIPKMYYEAALIDGANSVERFKNITIPMLGPAITINILLCVIGAMKTFDIIYATTGGGPGYATESFASLIFTKAFKNGAYGYGTAASVILFVLIMIISYVLGPLLRKREIEF